MKVSIVTLGCRVNQSESSVLEVTLEGNGVTIVDLNNNPDICIINTCSVTQKSDSTSRHIIRKAAKTGAKVIVTGCYAQLHKNDVKNIPGVIRVVDNRDKDQIADFITGSKPGLIFNRQGHARPILKVQDGCNYRCSYCTVPNARGVSRSIALEEILDRVNSMVQTGINEVVLTGIHLGTYGIDLQNPLTINDLLRAILEKTDIPRVRLSSLEINEIDDEMLEIMQDNRVCRGLHIPIQSGSDKILRLMRRNYDSGLFRRRIDRIISRLGDIGLGTDIIAGFPGEGIGEFQETYDLINSYPFTYLHVFPFSPRPGTDASKMVNRPANMETKRRSAELMKLGIEKKRHYMKMQFNKALEIVLEDYDENGIAVGTSGNYLKIMAPMPDFRKGSVETVRPVSIEDDMLMGVLVATP